MVLQGLPAVIRAEIFPTKEAWSFKVRWDRNKEDIRQLWSKIQEKVMKTLVEKGSKVSGIAFGSLDGSTRVADEDDLMSFIENAIDDEEAIQLRAITQVRIDVTTTNTSGCRAVFDTDRFCLRCLPSVRRRCFGILHMLLCRGKLFCLLCLPRAQHNNYVWTSSTR